jgi:hypothetical protein
MTRQIVENFELFSEAQLESLEFLPEELENIESELYPNLDSISPEKVAKDLEAYFEGDVEQAGLEARGRGGSHVMMKMAARIQYGYRDKQGRNHYGTTTPVRYGGKFKQNHDETPERKLSRETACKLAWKDLPKLEQGEVWIQRRCRPFQQR